MAETRVDARTLDLRIDSPALGAVAGVRVLLPPGWSRHAQRTWPVLYLLHGGGGNYRSWATESDVAWETFHLTEVRELLERDYRAGSARAIGGISMGGQGAMAYAARHPGMFRAAASYSGGLHTLRDPLGLRLAMLVNCFGTDYRRIWGDPEIPEQRVLWQRHNAYDLADRLRGVRLFVSSGDGTPGPFGSPLDLIGIRAEQEVHRMTTVFVERLRRSHIPVTTYFGEGTHSWPYWQRQFHASLPTLLAAIGG